MAKLSAEDLDRMYALSADCDNTEDGFDNYLYALSMECDIERKRCDRDVDGDPGEGSFPGLDKIHEALPKNYISEKGIPVCCNDKVVTKKNEKIKEPHAHDVLLGGRNSIYYHDRNKYFRKLLHEQLEHSNSPWQQVTMLIAGKIKARNPPGRFLKKEKDTGLWYELSEREMLQQIRTAFRSAQASRMAQGLREAGDFIRSQQSIKSTGTPANGGSPGKTPSELASTKDDSAKKGHQCDDDMVEESGTEGNEDKKVDDNDDDNDDEYIYSDVDTVSTFVAEGAKTNSFSSNSSFSRMEKDNSSSSNLSFSVLDKNRSSSSNSSSSNCNVSAVAKNISPPSNSSIPVVTKSVLLGTYENHMFDIEGKNDWHYVTLTKGEGPDELIWTNRANISWSLVVTDNPKVLKVRQDCPYYTSGHTKCEILFNQETGDVSLLGPFDEPYDKHLVSVQVPKQIHIAHLPGKNKSHVYDHRKKDDWRNDSSSSNDSFSAVSKNDSSSSNDSFSVVPNVTSPQNDSFSVVAKNDSSSNNDSFSVVSKNVSMQDDVDDFEFVAMPSDNHTTEPASETKTPSEDKVNTNGRCEMLRLERNRKNPCAMTKNRSKLFRNEFERKCSLMGFNVDKVAGILVASQLKKQASVKLHSGDIDNSFYLYTQAIDRAEISYKKKEYQKCLDDCNMALLKGPVLGLENSYICKAQALVGLCRHKDVLKCLQDDGKLTPSSEKLKKHMEIAWRDTFCQPIGMQPQVALSNRRLYFRKTSFLYERNNEPWTPEEESFANRLVEEFKAGNEDCELECCRTSDTNTFILPLVNGMTLTTFLSKCLNCAPTRICNKFVGSDTIVFQRKTADANRLTPEEGERKRAETNELRQRFLERLAEISRIKLSMYKYDSQYSQHINGRAAGHQHDNATGSASSMMIKKANDSHANKQVNPLSPGLTPINVCTAIESYSKQHPDDLGMPMKNLMDLFGINNGKPMKTQTFFQEIVNKYCLLETVEGIGMVLFLKEAVDPSVESTVALDDDDINSFQMKTFKDTITVEMIQNCCSIKELQSMIQRLNQSESYLPNHMNAASKQITMLLETFDSDDFKNSDFRYLTIEYIENCKSESVLRSIIDRFRTRNASQDELNQNTHNVFDRGGNFYLDELNWNADELNWNTDELNQNTHYVFDRGGNSYQDELNWNTDELNWNTDELNQNTHYVFDRGDKFYRAASKRLQTLRCSSIRTFRPSQLKRNWTRADRNHKVPDSKLTSTYIEHCNSVPVLQSVLNHRKKRIRCYGWLAEKKLEELGYTLSGNNIATIPRKCSAFKTMVETSKKLSPPEVPKIELEGPLTGIFLGEWQSTADHLDRQRMIHSIIDVICPMMPDLLHKCPSLAKSLEETLYRNSLTRNIYMNKSTLRDRLHNVANLEYALLEMKKDAQKPEVSSRNALHQDMNNES